MAEGGYQLGNFPPGWSEWNDKYRDAVRSYWKGDGGVLGELASRLSGSSDIFQRARARPDREHQLRHRARRLHAAGPGELRGQAQRGQPRGQPRRLRQQPQLRTAASRAHATMPQIRALREKQKRNLLATLLFSQGVPMLLAGDEIGRTQQRQQQRVLPGQRALVARLGDRRGRARCSSFVRS